MNSPKASILHTIDTQVQNKLAMKMGTRKKLKNLLEKLSRIIYYRLFSASKMRIKKYDGSSTLGADQFGRDVAHGVSRYMELLRNRGLRINTLIVLGSRAKSSWKLASDVDVTIIGDNLPKENNDSAIKRILGLGKSRLLSDRPICLGIEPSGCCSRQEFLRRIEEFDIQALDALYYGIVIYDNGFWREAKQKLHEMEEKYGLKEAELKEKLLYI